MDSEKCKIKLDSPANAYYAGQEIKGQISIVLAKKTKIRGIYFKIIGYGKCSWCDFLRRESEPIYPSPNEKDNQRSMVYSSKEEYLSQKSYIIGSKSSRPMELDPGSHSYEFQYTLERHLPSTFKGNFGSIKYKMEFIVEKAWNFDDKYTIPITIIKSRPVTPMMTEQPLLHQLTRNIGVFGGGPITLVCEIPRTRIVRGNTLSLRASVDNRSSTHVDKLKFSIKQLVTYFSQQPVPAIRRDEVIKIFKKETGGIQKKSNRTFEHELQLPLCQPSDSTCSRIITIAYEVQVDAILPGLYKNLTITLPFYVRSHAGMIPPLIPPQNNNNAIIGWVTLYPSPNSSLCSLRSLSDLTSSPAHSFEFPSFSSNSSYSNSSGINSSSRSSFRNSTGFSSLPSAPSYLPSTSQSSHCSSDIPPPSYEELFGNSSSQRPENKPSTLT